MNRRSLLTGFISLPLAGGVANAAAHQMKYSLSKLQWHPDVGQLEVSHSLHLDDAMRLLARLGDPNGEMDAASQAKLLHYIDDRFRVFSGDQYLPLEAVGAQVEGDFLWAYQEYPLPILPQALSVQCRLLHDVYNDPINQVNLVVGSSVRTLEFSVGDNEGMFGQSQ